MLRKQFFCFVCNIAAISRTESGVFDHSKFSFWSELKHIGIHTFPEQQTPDASCSTHIIVQLI